MYVFYRVICLQKYLVLIILSCFDVFFFPVKFTILFLTFLFLFFFQNHDYVVAIKCMPKQKINKTQPLIGKEIKILQVSICYFFFFSFFFFFFKKNNSTFCDVIIIVVKILRNELH